MTSFLVLQLADAAFPSGGYAHSAGLEACAALGSFELEVFCVDALRAAARSALPFVVEAHAAPNRLADLDALADASLTSHVANRASRAQGRALATMSARVFDALGAIATYAKSAPAHHAPVFGAVFGALGVSADETRAAFLHGVARTTLSSAVRLGLAGPIEAQRIHASCRSLLDTLVTTVVAAASAAQTAPILELLGALHDELDGRLFQS